MARITASSTPTRPGPDAEQLPEDSPRRFTSVYRTRGSRNTYSTSRIIRAMTYTSVNMNVRPTMSPSSGVPAMAS